MRFDVIEITT